MNEQIKVNEQIKKYIEYYIELDDPQYAVLLTGNWGCGKTYFIKKLIEKLDSTEDKIILKPICVWLNRIVNFIKKLIRKRKKSDGTEDKIILKPIYVSLNGISDTHSINEKIRAEISPFLYSKGLKIAKSVAKGLLKATTKIALDFDEDKKADGNISFNIDFLGMLDPSNEKIEGKRILIFDDIERCVIKTDEIFGYINNFVEHSRCKVILLTDEEKIKVKYQKSKSDIDIDYKDFKEKLIGQTFKVQSEIDTALDLFIKEINKNNQNLDLSEHKDLIKELFVSSKLENLRVFKQALLDFNRLTTYIDKKLTDHDNYDEFIENLLAYFIIVYIEYKTGNENIEQWWSSIGLIGDKKDNDLKKIADEKYLPILEKFKCRHSGFLFPSNEIFPSPLDYIVDYIKKGTISENELNDKSRSNGFFMEYEEQDWKKLRGWWKLEDDVFIKLRDKVWTQFTKGEISEITDLLDIAGIFISLIHAKLLLHKKEEDIVSRSEQILKTIFEKNSTYLKEQIKYHIKFGSNDVDLFHQYQSFDSHEFKEIKKFLGEKVKNHQTKISVAFRKKLFEEITEDSINLLDTNLKETFPDGNGPYNRTAIFKEVDGKKLGERIKSFKNESIGDFHAFIHRRYVNLENYHKEDITCLVGLKEELEKNRDPNKPLDEKYPIKNYTLNAFIKELEKCVKKIKGI